MTPVSAVQEWLDARVTGVPAGLLEKIRVAASAEPDVAASHVSVGQPSLEKADQRLQTMLRVVDEQLGQLKNRECTDRQEAFDLLSADALITYALELAASVQPDALETYAAELIHLAGTP